MKNSINLELTKQQKERLITILHERYTVSLNLFEISDIKSMLLKLGEKVDDWTPSPDYLKK